MDSTHYSHNPAPPTTRSDAFCRPPPPRAATTPAAGAGTAAARAAATPGAAARTTTSCFPRRRDGKECRPYTHNDTKVLIRHLHKTSHHIIFYACGDLLNMHLTNVAVFGG